MSNQDHNSNEQKTLDLSRRKFLGTGALAGLAGAGMSMGLAGCNKGPEAAKGEAKGGDAKADAHGAAPHIAPGQLDEYYALYSGGHTGDVRVLGLPSGREIHRVPVFVPDASR